MDRLGRALLVHLDMKDLLVSRPHAKWSIDCMKQMLKISRVRPQPPTTNSVILGVVTRLSPMQATVAISVVDGIPLPSGEEFSGVIRSQDVRATEKDKVRIGDCFRGGDVVKGIVVSRPSNFDLGDYYEQATVIDIPG